MTRLRNTEKTGFRLRRAAGAVPLLAMLLASAWAQDLQVTAEVNSNVVGLQDQFQLTVTATGGESRDAEAPKLPRFQNFRVVAGPGLSTQFQWINGRSTSSKSFIYTLLPEKEGQFTLDPIEVVVGGRIYRTQPITIRVTSAAPAPPPRRLPATPFGNDEIVRQSTLPSGDQVYVTAELDREAAYPGQQVTLTYHLLTQVGVSGLQLQENPPLNGFWVENLEVEARPAGTRRIVDGREYTDYVVKKQALFANGPGMLKIPVSTFAISVRTAGDLFGLFGQPETAYRKTSEITLHVRPLPQENCPADFNNAVGSFTLTDEVNRTEVSVGDAVSLRVTLAGRGNLKQLPDITFPPAPDLTLYSSKREDNVRPVAGDLIGGEKLWEYVIVPKAPGNQTIPALSFSYFDPELESYRTVSTAPISLKVAPASEAGSTTGGLSGINRQNLTRQGTDINFIKLSGENLEPRRPPLHSSPWFYVLASLSLLFSTGSFVIQKRLAQQTQNVVLARSRRAKRAALRRLRKAEKAGRVAPRRFYDEAATALEGYLEDKFNLPGIAVTADTLERVLEQKDIDPVKVKEAVAILQECDFGRFVTASQAPEQRTDLGRRIRGMIDTLERAQP